MKFVLCVVAYLLNMLIAENRALAIKMPLSLVSILVYLIIPNCLTKGEYLNEMLQLFLSSLDISKAYKPL